MFPTQKLDVMGEGGGLGLPCGWSLREKNGIKDSCHKSEVDVPQA